MVNWKSLVVPESSGESGGLLSLHLHLLRHLTLDTARAEPGDTAVTATVSLVGTECGQERRATQPTSMLYRVLAESLNHQAGMQGRQQLRREQQKAELLRLLAF